jgi:hypothetical protein
MSKVVENEAESEAKDHRNSILANILTQRKAP